MLQLRRTLLRAGRVLPVAVLAIACAVSVAIAQDPDATADSIAATTVTLSDEHSHTYTAKVVAEAAVRAKPNKAAKVVTHLHFQTEDGYAEVYLVLARLTDADGKVWLHIRIPGRPNGRTGWVGADALGGLKVVYRSLVVRRVQARATLYDHGKAIWTFRVGTGKPSTPTPPGRFWVREKFRVTHSGTIFGPFAFGTADYSVLSEWPRGGVIGIHGTDEPELIPGRPSHGCIRVRNNDIRKLYKLLPVGAPVRVI